MTENGFIKVSAAVPKVHLADCDANAIEIFELMSCADARGVSVMVFPELTLTGYTCADLFTQPYFVQRAEEALQSLLSSSAATEVMAFVGMPVQANGRLYNCAVAICRGQILGVVPKSYLPNYSEFYEARWFVSGAEATASEVELCGHRVPFGTDIIFDAGGVKIGVEVCEDLWVPIPPSSYLALQGADIIVNMSATDEMVGKHGYLMQLISQQSARTISAYVYASSGFGESTTDLVFPGNAIVAEYGTVLAEGERFVMQSHYLTADIDILKLRALRIRTTTFCSKQGMPQFRTVGAPLRSDANSVEVERTFDPYPFIPSDDRSMAERCREIFNIQTTGLAQRFLASHSKTAVIGISGGLDSTLALLVAVRTMDRLNLPRTNVIGVTMPGFGTTGRTYNNAIQLMKALGVTIREVSIKDACLQHFKDIDISPDDRSVTYENSQARERTQILMDIANRDSGMVIGTGDLSELALGWATYNGDHMSMYGVNGSVPKTLVKFLVSWVASDGTDEAAKPYLLDIVDTPISPELLPADANGNIAQKTEDLVGPYELHDFFLYNYVRFGFSPKRLFFMASRAFGTRYDGATVKKWLVTFMRRFFNQQFKRSALPDGPKVGSVSLSPRGDWRMPSDAMSAMWLDEANSINPNDYGKA